jgi:hypothetical protein
MASKVKSFRVDDALNKEIEKAKNASGLSYADLIKLGAGISRSYIESKIDEQRHLQDKIDELAYRIREKEEELEKLSQPFEEQIEKEKARRKKQLKDELAREEAEFNYQMDRKYRELAEISEKVRKLKEEKDKLEAQVKSKKVELKETTDTLAKLQERCGEHQMMNFMMMLTMMGAFSNVAQSLSQGHPPSQQIPANYEQPNPNPTDTTKPNLQQGQYLPAQPNITDATALLTQCLPVLMMGMMASIIGSPAKKKPAPPEIEPASEPLLDFAERLRETKIQKAEPKTEIHHVEEVSGEREEEDREGIVEQEELDED